MKHPEKQARRLYKALKGRVDIHSIRDFLLHHGFAVVFFNTEEGDAILKSCEIQPLQEKAFTFCGTIKAVFIDNNIPADDKLYSILHECGHILLGHLEDDQLHSSDNCKLENEAEIFAHTVLNYKSYRRYHTVIPALASLAAFISLALFITSASALCALHEERKETARLTLAMANATAPTQTSSEDYVYITPNGKRYHTKYCSYAQNNSAKMQKDEAEKIYSPCSICDP